MNNQLKNIEDKKPMGLLEKAFVAAGGLVLGTGAMLLSVNHMIYNNLKKAMQPGMDAMKRLAMHGGDMPPTVQPADVIHHARRQSRNHFDEAMRAHAANDSLYNELTTGGDTLLNHALDKASKRIPLADERILQDVERIFVATEKLHGTQNAYMAGINEAQRMTLESEVQRCEKLLKEVPGHLPLLKRLGLSNELHLTGNQKLGAGLAFVGGAAVTAGALYYSLKHYNESKDKVMEAQRTGMY